MELKFGVISVDDHVQEHPEVWTSRLSKAKFGDRIPQIKRQPDGSEIWQIDGVPISLRGGASEGVAAVGGAMADPTQEPKTWDEVPKETYIPSERLNAMDQDGIDASVLFPNVAGLAGEAFGRITDPELELACIQAYNDFITEEWGGSSERFIPLAMVPLSPIETTLNEINRAVKKGARGIAFPAAPWHLRELPHINEPNWDPVWSLCEDLQIPLNLHAGSSDRLELPPAPSLSPELAYAMKNITRPIGSGSLVPNFLMSGILERHPKLQVIFAESTLTWGIYQLEFIDHGTERQRKNLEGHPIMASELFRRQCYFTCWYDQMGLKARHYPGVEHILWGTSYPLTTSTWPNSKTYIQRAMVDIPSDEQNKMLWGNALRLYRIVTTSMPRRD